MHESKLRMQSYGAMNRATWIRKSGDLVKFYPAGTGTRTRDEENRDAGLFGWRAGWI